MELFPRGTKGISRRRTTIFPQTATWQRRPTKSVPKPKADEQAFDRPNGQGQQDYLRRLAKSLKKQDNELHKINKR